jgi:hypothetical protein
MVLADGEDVDADVLGQDRLVDHVAQRVSVRVRSAAGVERDVTEGVEAELV